MVEPGAVIIGSTRPRAGRHRRRHAASTNSYVGPFTSIGAGCEIQRLRARPLRRARALAHRRRRRHRRLAHRPPRRASTRSRPPAAGAPPDAGRPLARSTWSRQRDGRRHRIATTIAGVYLVEPDGPRRRARRVRRDVPAGVVPARAGRWCRPTGPTASGRLRGRPALPPAPGRLLVRALRRGPHRAARPARRVARPTARRSTLDLGGGDDTTSACSSRPGVAHGFAALTDMTITYLVDGYYNPADELGVAWDDPADRRRLGRRRAGPLRARPDQPASAPTSRAGRAPATWPDEDLTDEALRHRRRRLHRLQLRALACSRTPTTRSPCSTR